MSKAWLFALSLVALAAPATAQMTPADQAAVQNALDRGTLLYRYDQAAWHGTDDMLTKVSDPGGKIGGWIVDGSGERLELIFYDKDRARAVYVAQFNEGKLLSGRVLGESEDRTLNPLRKRMIAALGAARAALVASDAKGCVDRPFNTVVLPPAKPDGPIAVYFLTPQTEARAIPLGGHFMFEIGPDGRSGPIRRFTNTCLTLSAKAAKAESEAEALFVTHLLDPTPTEIHVFSMFAIAKPIFVGTTDKRTWAVEASKGQARIRLLKKD